MLNAYFPGFLLGLGLIVAIGAQNAFVLRQGLRRDHVFAVCLVCAFSDAVLITTGVASFGGLTRILPWLTAVMRYGGAAFLCFYGLRSLRSALRNDAGLAPSARAEDSFGRTIAACLAVTWLNPHVYLDTVSLLGSVSTQYDGRRTSFALGAITSSFLFFFGLGYGARLLRPLFADPRSWRVLDAVIALVMGGIATSLVVQR